MGGRERGGGVEGGSGGEGLREGGKTWKEKGRGVYNYMF